MSTGRDPSKAVLNEYIIELLEKYGNLEYLYDIGLNECDAGLRIKFMVDKDKFDEIKHAGVFPLRYKDAFCITVMQPVRVKAAEKAGVAEVENQLVPSK